MEPLVVHHKRFFRREFLGDFSEPFRSLRLGFHGHQVLDLFNLTSHSFVVPNRDFLPNLVKAQGL